MVLTDTIPTRVSPFVSPIYIISSTSAVGSNQNHSGNVAFKGDISAYLRTYLKENHPLDQSLFYIQWSQSHRRYVIKQDTPYALELHYGSRTRALIGFDVQDDALRVGQIQGAYGEKEVLPYFTWWDSMLLTILTGLAREADFRQMRVQRAEANRYWNGHSLIKSRRELLAHQRRLQKRYNGSAERNGFKLDPIGLNDFVLDLEGLVEKAEVKMH